jgi:uncharacterized Tic20 family protein
LSLWYVVRVVYGTLAHKGCETITLAISQFLVLAVVATVATLAVTLVGTDTCTAVFTGWRTDGFVTVCTTVSCTTDPLVGQQFGSVELTGGYRAFTEHPLVDLGLKFGIGHFTEA